MNAYILDCINSEYDYYFMAKGEDSFGLDQYSQAGIHCWFMLVARNPLYHIVEVNLVIMCCQHFIFFDDRTGKKKGLVTLPALFLYRQSKVAVDWR